jgi:small subunit ribosomal protein S1
MSVDSPNADSSKPASDSPQQSTADAPGAAPPIDADRPARVPIAEAPAADAEEPTKLAERPRRRIQIGSQRGGSDSGADKPQPKPVTPVTKPKPKIEPKHYPPPNIRDNLPPELEQEYLAAVGDMSLDDLLDEQAAGGPPPELAPESRIAGRVVKIHREDVFVDLPGRNQGIVPLRQFDQPPELGAELELVVTRLNAEEGLYELSRPTAAVDVGNWYDVAEGQIVEVTVTGSNKGGLECQVASLRGFIPLGQLSIYRVEQPEDYVGQRLACVVTEANRERRNLVLSHRAVMERERAELREKLLAELAPGQIREGVVRSIKDFGAFVDLGGVDGLVHISQLSWDRVGHPSEVVELGQTIKVRVEKFDKESGKVSLSYREVGENPWTNVASKFPIGARMNGVVTRLMDFGAFVKLAPGVEGLIHVSELSYQRVWRPSDVLNEGQEVEVKVLSVDEEQQRIGLSLKALMDRPVKPSDKNVADEDLAPPPDAPKPPRKKAAQLKGGIGGPSGGEKFGLNW